MDNRGWYYQQGDQYNDQSSPAQGSSSSSNPNVVAGDFHNSQTVLTNYPFASATPASSHGALSNHAYSSSVNPNFSSCYQLRVI